ncbi:MAG: MBL fold metallo-hydrolase [Desulfobacterota bacterium]|nr:MBL fold metallo-hydrolase [Thermodesulfobacteriota bacterium]
MPVIARWLGTAAIELHHEGQNILIDPYVSRLSKSDIFLKPLRSRQEAVENFIAGMEGELGALLCGHTHFDHALDIPGFAQHTDAPILGCASLDALLSLSGFAGRVTVCGPRERVHTGKGTAVTMIPSLHGLILSRLLLLEGDIDRTLTPPLRAHRYRLGAMRAVKVELGGVTFLHVGSAGLLEGELLGHTCDVLFLCAAGWRNSPGYPERVVDIVRPSCVIPIHYDDFSLPLGPGNGVRTLKSADLDGFVGRLNRTGSDMETRLLAPGMRVSF